MQTYQFTVYLQGVEVLTDDMAEMLFEAGCDDGTPSSGNGIAKVRFHREAQSLEDAIASAVGHIRPRRFECRFSRNWRRRPTSSGCWRKLMEDRLIGMRLASRCC